jgi:hypothetical protein
LDFLLYLYSGVYRGEQNSQLINQYWKKRIPVSFLAADKPQAVLLFHAHKTPNCIAK